MAGGDTEIRGGATTGHSELGLGGRSSQAGIGTCPKLEHVAVCFEVSVLLVLGLQ